MSLALVYFAVDKFVLSPGSQQVATKSEKGSESLSGNADSQVSKAPAPENDSDPFYKTIAVFLVYPDFDPTPFPSLVRMLEREKITRPAPTLMPFACPRAESAS